MEKLEEDILGYKSQLDTIDKAIAASAIADPEMSELRESILQLIELTEQNLLEKKKQELLRQLDVESNDTTAEGIHVPETSVPESAFVVGSKCRAPFTSRGREATSLFNAVIFAHIENDATKVRVVFTHPVEKAMLPCPFFLENKCRFSDEKCRFSHGEVVSLSDLEEFVPPDYSSLVEGCPILAKSRDSRLWQHATVDMVCENEVLVKWSGTQNENLPLDLVYPLPASESHSLKFMSNDSQTPSSLHDEDEMIVCIDPTAQRLGGWEEHTKGIGSKLMAKMGYIFGSGLGKMGDGRVEPVPTIIYPVGKSLDWCMDRRHGINIEDRALKKPKERKEKVAANHDVFDLVNAACSSRSAMSLHKEKQSLPRDVDGKKASLNVQGFQIEQGLAKLKQEARRLEESAARHRGKDKATHDSIVKRLENVRLKIRSLEGQSTSVEKDKVQERERKRLTTF